MIFHLNLNELFSWKLKIQLKIIEMLASGNWLNFFSLNILLTVWLLLVDIYIYIIYQIKGKRKKNLPGIEHETYRLSAFLAIY